MDVVGRIPSIPEYFQMFINKDVNLLDTPKVCCPFHQEDTPSFSYSADKAVWRCFGGCKCGGDVYELHKKNYRLHSREDAITSLNALCKVYKPKRRVLVSEPIYINEEKVQNEILYQKALALATTTERMIEMDYVMSKYPIDYYELKDMVNRWTGVYEKVDAFDELFEHPAEDSAGLFEMMNMEVHLDGDWGSQG